jgi:hypothetical protein
MVNSFSNKRLKFQSRWNRIAEKNGAELRAFLTGSFPRYLTTHKFDDLQGEVPVFVFHSVQPGRFEAQLKYLVENDYSTLDADELLDATLAGKASQRKVALTFDDATASAWTVAHPLLKKYGLQGILFAIPGLVPEPNTCSPTLEDVWKGQADLDEVMARERSPDRRQQLCTWPELQAMQAAKSFDIQAHSMTHARIHISPRVVDFLHPGFDTYFFHNVNIPVSSTEQTENPERELRYGQPVYASASRLSGRPRFLENKQVSRSLGAYVKEQGGTQFFKRENWRMELLRAHEQQIAQQAERGEYETESAQEAALRWEMVQARKLLQEHLPGKKVEHLCYPWYQGSRLSDRIAAESGYKAVYYGLEARKNRLDPRTGLVRFRRISEEYLECLPGTGAVPARQVWIQKITRSLQKKRIG